MAPDNPGTPAFPLFAAMHAVPNEPFAIPRNQKSRTCGLFPLSRGTPNTLPIIGENRRFIPALVGNTYAHRPRETRPRGEHQITSPVVKLTVGLSPLSQGTLPAFVFGWGLKRFIPALAGNTAHHHFCNWEIAVYPRSRGEHPICQSSITSPCGLSPLSRGTLLLQPQSLM